jgi:hypothetical protein
MLVLPIPAAIQRTVTYGVTLIGNLFDANHLYFLFSHVSYISGLSNSICVISFNSLPR